MTFENRTRQHARPVAFNNPSSVINIELGSEGVAREGLEPQ